MTYDAPFPAASVATPNPRPRRGRLVPSRASRQVPPVQTSETNRTRRTTIGGLGMLAYSALNSLGWALHESPATAVPMVATLILVFAAAPLLLARTEPHRKEEDP